jgi:N-acetyl-gamma-glutamylphosphate reductase
MSNKAIIVGASGLIGSNLLNILLTQASFLR